MTPLWVGMYREINRQPTILWMDSICFAPVGGLSGIHRILSIPIAAKWIFYINGTGVSKDGRPPLVGIQGNQEATHVEPDWGLAGDHLPLAPC